MAVLKGLLDRFMFRSSSLLRLVVLAGALVVAHLPAPALAQQVTAPELKAAFLFNFVKFTTWPVSALPEKATIIMCVLGDGPVASALDVLTKGQRVHNRNIAVVRLGDRDAPSDCHLLYASDLSADSERGLLDAARDKPVLTASDSSSFMQHGGIAAFRIVGGRMRFSVNPSAADRARLRISSRLLSLAVIVKDGDDVENR